MRARQRAGKRGREGERERERQMKREREKVGKRDGERVVRWLCTPVLTRGLRERESETRRREPRAGRWGRERRRRAPLTLGEGGSASAHREEGALWGLCGKGETKVIGALHCGTGRRA